MRRASKIQIGVLALQGAFQLHQQHLLAAGAEYVEVSEPKDLSTIDGIILPGGESGVQLRLVDCADLHTPLLQFLKSRPTWGICAGAILMAQSVTNPEQKSYSVMDIDIKRNAYGRQLNSSEEIIDGYQVSFIRAPLITRTGPSVDILSRKDGTPTWVECENKMLTTFHPELNPHTPSPWHRRLIKHCRKIRTLIL